jgi:ATP-dependent DNA helicase RecG
MKVNYLKEKVIKQSDRPESNRIWNYSYEVLKEAIANAMYHRSYQIREPVEIRVYFDKIIILNRPGPDKSITNKDIKNMNFISRTYRNNRIGDFLKELKLTEGRGTGIPKILRKSRENNSPRPVIKTSRNRDYFMMEIPINRSFIEKRIEGKEPDAISLRPSGDQVGSKSGLSADELIILEKCKKESSVIELMGIVGRKNRTKFRDSLIVPLIKQRLIKMTIPDKPKSSKQKYLITEKGKEILDEGKK